MASEVNTEMSHLISVLNSESVNKSDFKPRYNKRIRKATFRYNGTMATAIAGKLSPTSSKKKTSEVMSTSELSTAQLSEKRRYKWQVGDKVDVKSLQSKLWHLSKIIAINRRERRLKIHYYNQNSKYDEWLSLRSTRIRSLNNVNEDNGFPVFDDSTNNYNDSIVDTKSSNHPSNRIITSKRQPSKKKSVSDLPCPPTVVSDMDVSQSLVTVDLGASHSTDQASVRNVVEKLQEYSLQKTNLKDTQKSTTTMSTPQSIENCNVDETPNTSNLESNNDTTLELKEPTTNPSKTYHTRKINRRYSLETIVVDDSFNKSGVLNYHGGYVRTVATAPNKQASSSTISNNRKTAVGKLQAKHEVVAESDTKNLKLKKLNSKKSSKRTTSNNNAKKKPKPSRSNEANGGEVLVGDVTHSADFIQSESSSISKTPIIDPLACSVVEGDADLIDKPSLMTDDLLANKVDSRDILSANDQNRASSNCSSDSQISVKDSSTTHLEENSVSSSFNEGAVQCICSSKEDDGIMLQCEHCFHWQHGSCVGFVSYDQIPQNYNCPLCSKPYFQQSSVPIGYLTLISNGYLGDTKLNQSCKLGPEIAVVISNTFKLKDHVMKLKNFISNNVKSLNKSGTDFKSHVEELFDVYNKLKIKTNKLFVNKPPTPPIPVNATTCYNDEETA